MSKDKFSKRFLLIDGLRENSKIYPSNIAVQDKHSMLTYLELDKLSSQLASTLVKLNVTANERIAIYLNKSIQAVVSIYGVLKSGATYVPIDPVAPIARVNYILKDCSVACIITTEDRMLRLESEGLNELNLKCVILVDGSNTSEKNVEVVTWDGVLNSPIDFEVDNNEIDRDKPAYILYTSGSTGQPKGVVLSHTNGIAFVEWAQKEFGINQDDVIASHAPLHFDLSIFDLFAASFAGAKLVLIPESWSWVGLALNKYIVENRVTVWYSVPSALIKILSASNLSVLLESKLRLVLFAGEVFPMKHLMELYSSLPNIEFYNLYGPTETNVCTYHKVNWKDFGESHFGVLPIGKACEYADLFVIGDNNLMFELEDEFLEGELCVAGSSTMIGYWGDLQKTEKAFIVADNKKAYKTGDIVRKNAEGELLYIGRRDNMIKSSGYRIEIGEIESVISSHKDVDEVAVVAKSNLESGYRIKAYVLPKSTFDAKDIKNYCTNILPRYMIPEEFVFLDLLPRTSTGKIDRTKLLELF